LTTVRRCPQICSNASCFALGTDLRGIRRIAFLLAMALLVLSPPPGAEVEAHPGQPEKCNPRLRWKTTLTIHCCEMGGKDGQGGERIGENKSRRRRTIDVTFINC